MEELVCELKVIIYYVCCITVLCCCLLYVVCTAGTSYCIVHCSLLHSYLVVLIIRCSLMLRLFLCSLFKAKKRKKREEGGKKRRFTKRNFWILLTILLTIFATKRISMAYLLPNTLLPGMVIDNDVCLSTHPE